MTRSGRTFSVRPLTSAHATAIERWRYRDRWSVYDSDGLLRAEDGYFAVVDAESGELCGFCCIGADARVPGLAEDPTLTDVGVGMDPALVHRGHGRPFAEAVLAFARERGATALRAVVQTWNEPSLRLTAALGFEPAERFTVEQGGSPVEYVAVVAR